MVEVDPTALGVEFLASAVIGGCIGFATKKVAKLLAIVVGVELMAVRYLESQGIVTIDWHRLSAGLVGTSATDPTASVDTHWIESVLSTLTIGAGFAGGFLIGYHRG
ncbi:FUN14 domain-containing protein [Halosolutus amylolyticus]|uniref:FUN14 domain-containing protein n=1 Tax=Halosolutus amylolyticus TaxID=2932267 RepID=A0ABD5PSX4_9EURY|nr:FUN14 domain-containing protein [Halosolutus amylolyticus]